MHPLLLPAELQQHLNLLPDWHYQPDNGGCISRDYQFKDFVQAFGFMAQMADFSEAIQHHPEWSNVYKHVRVTLRTHDSGGITGLDVKWATQADQVAQSVGRQAG
jgi:4a-hydroxytetrahydrobiopterin dehydratase